MSNELVVQVKNLKKVYKLYDKPIDRLKETLHPFRKSYKRDFCALESVSFEIRKGETIGIIGKNGSGKSTLLKILTGVLSATSGDVIVNGKIAALLELGAGFNPELTGLENIFLNGSLMGFSREEMSLKVDAITAFADISNFIHQPVKMYSSGMFARLAFSVAINVDPEILIVDEALSVGDAFFQSRCFEKFEELKSRGTTIIFVTHDLGAIIKNCDVALVLSSGNVVFSGLPVEAVDYYKAVFGAKASHESAITNAKNYGSGDAKFISCHLLNRDFNEVDSLLYGDEFVIELNVKCFKAFHHGIVSFGLRSADGLELTGTNTFYESNKYISMVQGDSIRVRFQQKMLLNAGSYLLCIAVVALKAGDFEVLDRRFDFMEVTVSSSTSGNGLFKALTTCTVTNLEN